ncbi:MAG: MFS transporter [Candidatus Helarchaeota archaeon]
MKNQSPTEKLRTLEGAKLWGYCAGVLGQILPVTLISAYVFIFFTYAVGLNALLVSIGTALGVIINAFFAPIWGYIIDKRRPSKWGKRRPFLILSLPIVFFSLVILWYSPLASQFGEMNWIVAIFLWTFSMSFFLTYSMLRAAYLSMQQEQSQTEDNRIRIGNLIGLFSIVGSVLGIFIPLIIQAHLITPDAIFFNPFDRRYLLDSLPLYGWIFGSSAVLFTLIAYFSTNEDFYKENTKSQNLIKEISMKKVLIDTFKSFKDPNFKLFLFAILFMTIGIRLLVKNLTLFFTFILNLKGAQFLIFILPLVIFAVLGFIFWSKRTHSVGVKKTYIQSDWFVGISLGATVIFLIDMQADLLLWIARILIAGVLFGLITGYTLPNPAISELVDTAPREIFAKMDTSSLSGAYFGTYLFIVNIANALGDIILGIILAGHNAESPLAVGLIFPIAGVLYLISISILNKTNMS